MENNELILNEIYNFFINSNDFNGIPLTTLSKITNIEYYNLIDKVKILVGENSISIQSSINPHIISLGHYETETQLKILEEAKKNKTKKMEGVLEISFDSHPVCLYPSEIYLKKHRDISEFRNCPFTTKLALGEPQLKPFFFKIEVLDRYYKDPRYSFKLEDYSGDISYTEDENNNPSVDENDQIFLKTLGLGIDENKNRVAVVYLRYLKGLTNEHQTYWKSKEVTNNCQMLNEYYVNTIEGMWTNSYSIFSGFIGEQKALNDITNSIYKIPLFNKTFEKENRPKEFTFFFIPTLKNYHDFVLLLDKMISDNINKDFFRATIELYELVEIEKGIVERKEKGTLRLLEEWFLLNYNPMDVEKFKEIFKPLKKIRKERQNPAHKINENVYDISLVEKQKELIQEAYYIIQTFRFIFQKHPKGKLVEIPKWLDKGEIKTF